MKLDVAGLSGMHYEMLLAAGVPLDEVLGLAAAALDLHGPPDSGEAVTERCPACCPTVPSARGEVVEPDPATVKTVPVTDAWGPATVAA